MNTQIIQERFSRAALDYDRHADIQKYFGNLLLERLKADKIEAGNILDIGTGTGNLLKGLGLVYPSAKITGLDISWGMLIKAKERAHRLLQADAANLPFKENSFDLAISNLSLQWLFDIGGPLSAAARVLSREGRFYFTIFGPQTLKELRAIFPALEERMILNDLPALENKLKVAGFQNISSQTIREKRIYPSLVDIIKWLKNIGANYTGYIPVKNLGMRKVWQEAEDSYRRKFGTGC
ncbi:MAG: methyltransferase domain-containing protein, partial [Candidatus Omnitrophica bacterium]|nr:methyltransferase domain-containing protein [Candidatus Omnitrophota bacterium]